MGELIRKTRSVCPVCLENLPARLVREADGRIFLEKSCPAHGDFRVPVWNGKVDWEQWLLGTPPLILPDDLLLSAIPTPTDTLRKDADAENAAAPLPLQTIEEMERDLIRRTVEHYEWNKTRSAKSLGIDRSTLDRKLKQYGIEPKGE